MRSTTNLLAIAGLVIILGAANFVIFDRQAVVESGRPVLLELRPADPRSLMQGDYMVLRYHDRLFPTSGSDDDLPRTGAFVISVDENNVASFKRVDDGSELGSNELLLKYKLRYEKGRIRLGAESYFFQEGNASLFNAARYGVLHVAQNGTSVLIGLADENHQLIQPPERDE
ncbi:MAG: GDYXXLXY domain-containing protein [Pseudomonadota bacterium]